MWNHSSGAGPSNRRQFQAYQPDVNTQTVVAIQKIARRELDEGQRKKAAEEDAQVFQQCGIGESDSDEDTGGIRIPLPKDQQLSHDDVFIPPAVLKQDRERAEKRAQSNFNTFPNQIAGRNPYARDDDTASQASSSHWSVASRRRSRSRSPRSRDDSRDSRRHRDDSRSSRRYRENSRDSRRSHHKKSKKKKHRRRSSSSSSSSGESRDSRRRRDDSPASSSSGLPMIRMPKEGNRNKYEFLDKNMYLWNHAANFIVTHRKWDAENYSLGCPRREISEMNLGVKYIVGLEHKQDFFNKLYGKEIRPEDRKFLKRSFAKELEEVSKHQPKETFFRRRGPIDGYWKVIQQSDILNEARDSGEVTDEQSSGLLDEIQKLRKAVKVNVHDIDSLIKYIDLEERNCKLNSNRYGALKPKDLADVILEKLRIAIQNNPKNTVLPVLKCEQMIKAERSTEDVLRAYKDATHLHPHDPMIWISYLDYVQYDSSVFTVDAMRAAFLNCLRKVEALVNQTFASHSHLITDRPAFREFHLYIYLRYLKWCFSNGCAPQAIANIQATMELNFGLSKKVAARERWPKVKDPFWANALPRIGDIGGVGLEEVAKKGWTEENALDLEREELQDFLRASLDALDLVRNDTQSMERNWVEFERHMQELDARPKRVNYRDFEEFDGAKEELDFVDLFYPIFHDDLTAYQAYSSVDIMDYTQPMLELLGVKFFHSPGCFTSTEQVISEWRRKDIFQAFRPNFPDTPSYTEKTSKTIGIRILKYLLAHRHEECKEERERLDDQMMKYLLAGIETEAQRMESDKGFFFYKLNIKNMKTLLNSLKNGTTNAYVDHYRRLGHALAMFASLKMTVWLERGVSEQKELEVLEKNGDRIDDEKKKVIRDHILLQRDREGLEKYRTGLWGFITTTAQKLEEKQKKELNDPTIPYGDLQILLYSKILLARQYVVGKRVAESVRQLLAGDIMQEEDDVITGLDANAALYRQFIGTLKEWVEIISKRDEREEEDGIPEFPRVGALCLALLWAVEFVFLEQNKSPRKTINLVAQSLLEKFNEYDKNRNDHTRRETQKYRDRVDIQFLFDTLIALFSHKNFRVSHYEDYQNLIIRASETFTCETKYMLKLAELFSTGRLQSMKIKGRIEVKNRELREKMRFQFDVQNERRLLMNTLADMFVTMRIAGRDTNPQFVADSWRKDALTLRDPAVWRMVLKAAGKVNDACVNEIFARANAQCPWALNLHIDYVEQNPKQLESMIQLRFETTDTLLHNFFIDDVGSLKTLQEIAMARLRDDVPEEAQLVEEVERMEGRNAEENREDPQNQNLEDLDDVKPSVEELQREMRRPEKQHSAQNGGDGDVKPAREELQIVPGNLTQQRREARLDREQQNSQNLQNRQDSGAQNPQNHQDQEDVKFNVDQLHIVPGNLTERRRDARLEREEERSWQEEQQNLQNPQDPRRREEEHQNLEQLDDPDFDEDKPTREELRQSAIRTQQRREANRGKQDRDRRREECQNEILREPKEEPME